MPESPQRNGAAVTDTSASAGGHSQPRRDEPLDGEDHSDLKLPKVIRFSSLATCGDEVWIENNGQLYRLRRTNQGKLILTK